MTMGRAVLMWATIGALIPLVWYLLQPLLGPAQWQWMYEVDFYRVFHIIWPTSILLMGDPLNEHLDVQVMASAGNVVFYTVIGALVWLGRHRSRWWLMLPVVMVGASWWWLFTL